MSPVTYIPPHQRGGLSPKKLPSVTAADERLSGMGGGTAKRPGRNKKKR